MVSLYYNFGAMNAVIASKLLSTWNASSVIGHGGGSITLEPPLSDKLRRLAGQPPTDTSLASFAHGGANDGVPLHEDVGHVSGLPARTAILYLTGSGLLTVGLEHVPAAPGRLVTFDGGSHAFAHDASEAHSDGFRYMIGPFSLDPLTFDSVGGSLTFEAIGNAGGVVTTNPPPSPPPPSPSLTAATVAITATSRRDVRSALDVCSRRQGRLQRPAHALV